MKPTIPEVMERFQSYYFRNPAWGALHTILGDGNTQDGFVDEAYEASIRQTGDGEGADLISLLRAMSRTQRIKLRAMVT